jgi:hypothetical protein
MCYFDNVCDEGRGADSLGANAGGNRSQYAADDVHEGPRTKAEWCTSVEATSALCAVTLISERLRGAGLFGRAEKP